MWALTKKMEDKLRVTRRRMLRYVLCLHRRPEEDWISYMQRSAHQAETVATKWGADDWVVSYRRKHFAFACRTVCATDDRRSKILVQWVPRGRRDPGRPSTRWSDDLDAFAGSEWKTMAHDADWCNFAMETFATWQR